MTVHILPIFDKTAEDFGHGWNGCLGINWIHLEEREADSFSQWCLVIAGMADFARPADKLSLTQNAALMGTGAIWTRWCLIIKPRNVLYVLTLLHPISTLLTIS